MDFKAFYLRNIFWINDFLGGSLIRKQYREIKFLNEISYQEALPYRLKKLHKLLSYVHVNSPYYQKCCSDRLSDYPVMNKLVYMENYDRLKISGKDIPLQKGPVFIQKTSGSTGMPLAIPQDTMKRKRRIAEMKYFNKKFGFDSHEKLFHLRVWNKWQAKSIRQINKENIIPFDIQYLDDNVLISLCNLIKKEKPVCIRGYASTLGQVTKVALKQGMISPPSLKVIISTSESLEDASRIDIKKAFRCAVISQYADEECGILANERLKDTFEENKMYFNHASYFFEVLKMNSDEPVQYGELGRIVVTDLHNYAFPIIRYDTGDTCILQAPDEYSNGYPVISKLYGRRFDLTYTTNGIPIYPLAYGRTIKNYSCIVQWQFVQKSEREYELKIVFNDQGSMMLDTLKSDILKIVGEDADLKFTEVENIPVLISGKRKPVINEWKK